MCRSRFSVRERHLYVRFSPKVKLVCAGRATRRRHTVIVQKKITELVVWNLVVFRLG